jgi:hypothetical protein
MVAEDADGITWKMPLHENDVAAIIGLLADGSVAAQLNTGAKASQVLILKKDRTTETLPWIPENYCGSVESATADMSRYGAFALDTCGDNQERWYIFDRRSRTPIVNRGFPRNGRAALAPDGLHYASFESGELRIYSLPNSAPLP